jgi:selenocysteine lyase/cysteine desulfurase
MSFKRFYQGFLAANPNVQHYACHSHHYWPDVTRDAVLRYWDDSARLVDDKWEHIFGVEIPAVQKLIAQELKLQNPSQIVFASNTHELLFRLLTAFSWQKGLKVLTTDSEFHSFSRQIARLGEEANVQVVRVAAEPFATFPDRFVEAAASLQPDLVFVSQVFFNSGVALPDLAGLVNSVAENCQATIAVDGYHGFMAIPTDLSSLEGRIFYLAGSYKYAQGGEGCCFMVVPEHNNFRPIYTGWFAEFGALSAAKNGTVQYSQDGYQFAGATMDFTALYRLRAVLALYQEQQISTELVHQHVQGLQQYFLQSLDKIGHPWLNRQTLLHNDGVDHGHFLTFRGPSAADVAELSQFLSKHQIKTDYRGDRLRFGFAIYHDIADINLTSLKEA